MTPIVRCLSVTYAQAHTLEAHAHSWGQLVYAAAGAISVTIDGADWLIPPARAVWLAPGVEHRLHMRGGAALRTVYLSPAQSARLQATSHGLEVSSLLRELILHIVPRAPLYAEEPQHLTLAALMADLLEQAQATPFRLRLPKDARAVRAGDLIRDDPAGDLSLTTLAQYSGATVRTLQRLFLTETGLRISEWRQAARLQHAAALLLRGSTVTEAGLASGYSSTSAFVNAFRRRTGQTPLGFRHR